MPKISVIMPVHNAEQFVGEALESVLSQSFGDFEFLILDDGSSDESYAVCKKYAEQDRRIKLQKNQENAGVVATRNMLLNMMSDDTDYIALLDADDRMLPDRLQKQYDFLERQDGISIVGSDIELIDVTGSRIGKRVYPHSHELIARSIFHKSPLAQPAVMIRRRDLEQVGKYNEDFERAQDYELWCRFYDAGYTLTNIDEPLTQYRVFDGQGKTTHLKLTLKNTMKIQKKYIFQKKYFSLNNMAYFVAEALLYTLPKNVILYLFQKHTYE